MTTFMSSDTIYYTETLEWLKFFDQTLIALLIVPQVILLLCGFQQRKNGQNHVIKGWLQLV